MTRSYVGWLWLLSGTPVGLALIFMPPSIRVWCFAAFVLLETAHSFSPIVLAWTHREFRRQVIYPQSGKFLLLPGMVAGAAVAIGIATQAGWTPYRPGPGAMGRITGWDNPFPLLVWFYSTWNLYHFAMQDFGVWRLWRSYEQRQVLDDRNSKLPGRRWHNRSGDLFHRWVAIRWVQIAICLFGLLGLYFAVGGINFLGFWRMPGLIQAWWVPFAVMGVVSVNHWVVDIGLSCRVAKQGWVFVAGVLAAGLVGFAWVVPTPNGLMIRMVPSIICARLGLGFVHFLYSRWVWQLSDPLVRATIGQGLLSA